MNISRNNIKTYFSLALLMAANNLYANPVVEQKFILNTITAHLDDTKTFKVNCPTCIETIKEDETHLSFEAYRATW